MIYLTQENIEAILEITKKFPSTNSFGIEQDSSSGIGSTTTLTVDTMVGELRGKFIVEISGLEKW